MTMQLSRILYTLCLLTFRYEFRRRFRYLLLCCDVFRALVNSLCLLTESKQLGRHSVSDYDNNDSSYIAL